MKVNRKKEIVEVILGWKPEERKWKVRELSPEEQEEFLAVLDGMEELQTDRQEKVRKISKRELDELVKEELSRIMGQLLQSTLYESKDPKTAPLQMTYKELKQLVNEEVVRWKEKELGGSPPTGI
jgi:predicted NodU family carbamoyl transferase